MARGAAYSSPMTARVRKFIGGIGLLAFICAYVWAAATIAGHLPDNGAVRLVYYAVVGLLWGVPVLPLITWMNRGR